MDKHYDSIDHNDHSLSYLISHRVGSQGHGIQNRSIKVKTRSLKQGGYYPVYPWSQKQKEKQVTGKLCARGRNNNNGPE